MKDILGLFGKTVLAMITMFVLIGVLLLADQFLLKGINMGNVIPHLSMCLTALLLKLVLDRRKEWAVGWQDQLAVNHTMSGALIITIVMAVAMSFMLIAGNTELVEQSWGMNVMLWQVIIFLLVAIGEEWLFRGYLFCLYQHHVGVKAAIFVNSLIFTGIHLINPNAFSRPLAFILTEMTNIFLLSLLMSIARAYSRSLWMPIGLHFTMNFLQSSIFGFINGGKNVESLFYLVYENKTIWNGAGYGLESSLIFTAVLIITNIGAIMFYRRSISSSLDKQTGGTEHAG